MYFETGYVEAGYELLALPRFSSDTENMSESVIAKVSILITKLNNRTVQLTENVLRVLGFTRLFNSTVSISSSVLGLIFPNYNRVVSEVVNITELAVKALFKYIFKVTSDVVNITSSTIAYVVTNLKALAPTDDVTIPETSGYVYLVDFLIDNPDWVIHIVKLTLDNGDELGITSYNKDLFYNGTIYTAVPLKVSGITLRADLQNEAIKINFAFGGLTFSSGKSVMDVIGQNILSGATVDISLYHVELQQAMSLFSGVLTADMVYDTGEIILSAYSNFRDMEVELPNVVYSELCQNNLYDTACGLNKATYMDSGQVGESSTLAIIFSSVFDFSAHAEGYWEEGYIILTSGPLAGETRKISKHQDGFVELFTAFPELVDLETFEAYPGCDKFMSTCKDKYNNVNKFMGFPFIPTSAEIYKRYTGESWVS